MSDSTTSTNNDQANNSTVPMSSSTANNNENYVDFNQFLLQHNLSHQPINDGLDMANYFAVGYYPSQVPYTPWTNMIYNGFDAYDQPMFLPEYNPQQNEIALTSNLLPTAAEFIPRFNNLQDLPNPEGDTTAAAAAAVVTSIPENNSTAPIETFFNPVHEGDQGHEDKREKKDDNNFNRIGHFSNNTGAISKSQSGSSSNNRNRYNNGYDHRQGGGGGGGGGQYRGSDDRYYQSGSYSHKGRQQNYDNRHVKRKDNWRNNREVAAEGRNFETRRENDELENVFKKIEIFTKDESNNEKLSQREKLINEIEARKLECLVCVEQIKSHQSVWSCSNCFHILHLNCVIKWAASSKSKDGWRCPACQNMNEMIPRDYYCFCGKVKNPQYNRNDTAHSCGEVCGRKDSCQHSCTLLCHPGPCPPCQANVTRTCGCGKTTKVLQCYIKEDIQCEAICEKLLNCDLHTCEKQCHQGKCANCEHKITQVCHCGKQERQVACTKDSNEKKHFSCGKSCNRDLVCGNHKCKDVCHSGDCKPCKLTPKMVTSCPCGKMPIGEGKRKSCLDPIPVCSGICGKTLKCGPPALPHHCVSKCHTGNCPPCNKQTAVKCRCGHMDQMIKCRQLSSRADDARCKKRCTKKRNCGRHKCNQECCIDIDHICPQVCNYTLSCGKHKCDQPCHRGNCPPCYRSSFDELYCECGANVIYPPVPCGTKRPVCDKPCSRQHPCDHAVQHNCHSGPTCPPCMIFTTKYCYGGHEQRKTIPCSQLSFSCGLRCGKELNCGRHKCIKPCHEGPCQVEGDICKQNCTKTRMICGHKCNAPCHEGDCPETPCKEMVEVICECGNRKQMRTCHDFASEFRRIATAQLASSMQEMQRGNLVELSDIMGPIKMTTNKTLECNDECKVVERNRRLAIALQSGSSDVPSSKILTRYSDFIKSWAKKDPQLVKMIYDNLTNLVKLAKESPQKSRSHSFPTMNREKRSLVHEMCSMFGVDSVAYDAEPNRNVVATAYKDRCWLPAMSIMEVMQRESGQRRVPVPNNNAWGIKK